MFCSLLYCADNYMGNVEIERNSIIVETMLNRFLASSSVALQTWAKSAGSMIDVVIGNEVVVSVQRYI